MRFFRRQPKRRLLVLGLDCAPPELVFETFHEDLPNLRQLATAVHGDAAVECAVYYCASLGQHDHKPRSGCIRRVRLSQSQWL